MYACLYKGKYKKKELLVCNAKIIKYKSYQKKGKDYEKNKSNRNEVTRYALQSLE